MPNAESPLPRPTLLNPRALASTIHQLDHDATCRADLWRVLTDRFVVDLDAVAALLPRVEPEPHWLPTRR